jgi:hypothetical protein
MVVSTAPADETRLTGERRCPVPSPHWIPACAGMTLPEHRVFSRICFTVKGRKTGMGRKLWLTGATCLFLILAGASHAAETLRLTNGEWPPFTSERFGSGGPLSRVVAAAFALENVSVEYGYFPWKRSYAYAKSGKWDGSVAWAPTPDHARDFYLSDPVIVIHKAAVPPQEHAFRLENDRRSAFLASGRHGWILVWRGMG